MDERPETFWPSRTRLLLAGALLLFFIGMSAWFLVFGDPAHFRAAMIGMAAGVAFLIVLLLMQYSRRRNQY